MVESSALICFCIPSRSADLVTTAFPENLLGGTMLKFEDLCVGMDVSVITNSTHCTKPEDRSVRIYFWNCQC